MSVVVFCQPGTAPAEVNFASGESSPCGVVSFTLPSFCPDIAPADEGYAKVFWALGEVPWGSKDVIWDSGIFGGNFCRDVWQSYNLQPSDLWQNIEDHWASLGTY